MFKLSFCGLRISSLVCSEGWTDINGKCYFASTDSLNKTQESVNTAVFPPTLPFEDAVVYCHQIGGRLLEPRNAATFAEITKVR